MTDQVELLAATGHVVSRGTGTPVTSGAVWAGAANMVDDVPGSNPATYATWTSSTPNAVGYIEVSGYAFGIPAGSTINLVTVKIRHFEDTLGTTRGISGYSLKMFDGATQIGSTVNGTLSTNPIVFTTTALNPTLAQLSSSGFKIRAESTHGNNSTPGTWSLDYIDITVDYTPGPANPVPPAVVDLITQPIHPLKVGEPVEAVWGQAVAEGVIQRFGSASDRDTKWPDAPEGALCFHDGTVWLRRRPEANWTLPWYPLTQQKVVIHVHRDDLRSFTMVDLTPHMPTAAYVAQVEVTCEGFAGYSMQLDQFHVLILFYQGVPSSGEGAPQPNWRQWVQYHMDTTWTAGGMYQAQWVHMGHVTAQSRVYQGGKMPTWLTLQYWNGASNMYADFYITVTYIPGYPVPFLAP